MFKFTVKGDPIGYLRMTQGQVGIMKIPAWKLTNNALQVRKRLKRYFDWKDYVNGHTYRKAINRSPKNKVFLNVMIYFSSGKHPDPGNIRKGIEDAIYDNDNKVAGSVDFDYDLTNPRCEIEIRET